MRERLRIYSARKLSFKYPEAGVLVPVIDSPDPEIILTQRAAHMNTHRGQVAFPGGRREEQDADLVATALRESHEEIGLLPQDVEVIAPLSQVISRYGILVSPFVGVISGREALKPNPEEIDSIFRVPVSFFLEDKRLRTDELAFRNLRLQVPCWEWEGYQIWGMSAIVLVDFLNAAFDAGIDLTRVVSKERI
jgi:8-oxo-dGTP pyrophosphatase MutT (NUDIX family)